MRIASLAMILMGTACCTTVPSRPEIDRGAPRYDIAYEAVEGGFMGMGMFIDGSSGETWIAFRDDREKIESEGYGEPLAACGQGRVGCFKEELRPPLLSALPPPDFLDGAFTYASRPRRFWAVPCTEISATAGVATTTSVVCPVLGLVEFSYANGTAVDRYQLKSWVGLFSQR